MLAVKFYLSLFFSVCFNQLLNLLLQLLKDVARLRTQKADLLLELLDLGLILGLLGLEPSSLVLLISAKLGYLSF